MWNVDRIEYQSHVYQSVKFVRSFVISLVG